MNANLEQIKQEIIAGAEELNSSKEVYEFKKKFLDGKTSNSWSMLPVLANSAHSTRFPLRMIAA